MKTTTQDVPSSATNSADAAEAISAWRGDVGLFPTTPGLTYREYGAETNLVGFGDGLLSPSDSNRKKNLSLPVRPEEFGRAELIVFGNGLINGECWVNEHSLPLRTLSEIATGKDAYPTCAYSVNRSYSLAEVPLGRLHEGVNTLRVPRCHAYLQSAVLRLFRSAPSTARLKLEVERPGARYQLRLTGADLARVAEVQFFARYGGPDLEMSGRERTWQATINKRNPDRDESYELSNHCGTAGQAPWTVTWEPTFVPDGKIEFRCRVKTTDGDWIESPGGTVERQHESADLIVVVRSEGFSPWGFHVCGANQNFSSRCEFRLVGPGFHAVGTRDMKRAVLAVPIYGTVDLDLKGHNSRHQMRISAPLGGYYVRHLELPAQSLFSRMNQLKLKTSGDTGCFQAPGPVLYMIYDK